MSKDRFLPVRIFAYPVPVAAHRRGMTYATEYGYVYSTTLHPSHQRAESAGRLEFGPDVDFDIAQIRDGQLIALYGETDRHADLAQHQARLEWVWT